MTKILIMDDNRQITSILDEYAKNEGYMTAVAYDGADGIRVFKEEQPDIILLGVMMANMNTVRASEQTAAALEPDLETEIKVTGA